MSVLGFNDIAKDTLMIMRIQAKEGFLEVEYLKMGKRSLYRSIMDRISSFKFSTLKAIMPLPMLLGKHYIPEWLDEEEEFDVPTCPSLPRIHYPGKPRADCKGRQHMAVKPNLNKLREKLNLPVGSCELAIPLKTEDNWNSGNARREAYATILHSAHVYVCGAIAAAQSIRMAGSTRDLVILVDESISDYHRGGLEEAGWKIHTIQRIRNPKAERDAYNEWNYSKFRLWQLTDYDKIIFIDADLLVLRNIDFIFEMPEITATGNNATLFNSGGDGDRAIKLHV
ncbi:hypothetical protein SASPL_131416 [Salvia splendens]|uniref:Hexosyltransferase n=1 Tax=Salvia splendens TaxID=180675 RepID=A0A8X8X5W3_SALSN|nr:hypothetical protein SASPL_131416 [Salvia splendens]